MRKILVGVAVLLVTGVGLFLATPRLSELYLEFTCKQPSDDCRTRMRAMGHVWSLKGDLARARTWYERPAAEGDAVAMFHLGWLHEREAVEFLQASIMRWAAARREGSDDEFTLPVNPPAEQAIAWYRRAADKGFAPAMNNLGQILLGGHLVGRQDEEGVRWMQMAARAGNPVAAMNMTHVYLSGQGVRADRAQAQFWSTWQPTESGAQDLLEPTFARTVFHGEPLPAVKRAEFRDAAAAGRPVTTNFTPVTKRDPSLPTFKSVQRRLEKQGR